MAVTNAAVAEVRRGSAGFATVGVADDAVLDVAAALVEALEARGFARAPDETEAGIVLNLVDRESPRPFRRRARGTFVAALWSLPQAPETRCARRIRCSCVRSRTSASATSPATASSSRRWNAATTSCPRARASRPRSSSALEPLATSHARDRQRVPHRPRARALGGRRADRGDRGGRPAARRARPAPGAVPGRGARRAKRDLRTIKRLYAIGGLSYGNLSARKDADRFWMSASGVDKSKLDEPGRDILLVSGYDADGGQDRPERAARRRAAPRLGRRDRALDDLPRAPRRSARSSTSTPGSTGSRRPTSTTRAARRSSPKTVAALVAAAPDPAHAVVGLRNHGITATGDSLGEILERIRPNLLRQVPMS